MAQRFCKCKVNDIITWHLLTFDYLTPNLLTMIAKLLLLMLILYETSYTEYKNEAGNLSFVNKTYWSDICTITRRYI